MRRIQRDSSFDALIKHLSSGDNPLFKEIWRLLLFASALGHHQGEKKLIARSDSGKAMPESYFSNCPAWPGFLYLLGICETESADVLKANDESQELLIGAFEQYATHGLNSLQETVNRFDDPLEAVLDLIMANGGTQSTDTKTIDYGDLLKV
jgi:dnd system-associated protein 4